MGTLFARSHIMTQRSLRFAFAIALFLPGLDASVTQGLSFSCARQDVPKGPVVSVDNPEPEPAAKEEVAKAPEPKAAPTPPPPTPRELLREWLTSKMPPGGAVEDDGPTIGVVHTAKKGDSLRALGSGSSDRRCCPRSARPGGADR